MGYTQAFGQQPQNNMGIYTQGIKLPQINYNTGVMAQNPAFGGGDNSQWGANGYTNNNTTIYEPESFDYNGGTDGILGGARQEGSAFGGMFDNMGMDQAAAGVGIGKDLFSMYNAHQGMGLAKQSLANQQAAFQDNKANRDRVVNASRQAFA